MTDHRPSLAELQRYLAGVCSPEEAERIERWIAASRGKQEWDTEAALARIKRNAVVRLIRSSPLPRPRRSFGFGRVAATLAAAVLVAVTWRFGGRAGSTTDKPVRRYAAVPGERMQVTLPDGTRLTLAPASTLDVPADYGDGPRTVSLSGEALFAVVHDARHPFVVHTAGGDVHDIGTIFDLRAYPAETERVVVTAGAVSVRGIAVHAGQLARVCDSTVAVERDDDVERHIAWASGRLVFHGTPLWRVALDLSRWYDLDVQVADSTLGRRLYSGSYTTESPDLVLSLLTAATHTRYARRGRFVNISLR
jgi:transmembrane sensor